MPCNLTRRLFGAVALPLAFVLASCGGSSGTPIAATTTGSTATPAIFTVASQSKLLNQSGGSVLLTAADGTQYQLDLPANAVTGETTVSLTTQAPGAGQQFNVLLQPAGLLLSSGNVATS